MLRKLAGGTAYDVFLEAKLHAVLAECRRNGVKIIANAGGLDIEGAAEKATAVARELGLAGTKVAYVAGGDVLDAVRVANPPISETGQPVSSLGNGLLGAHAYGGAWPIAEALAGGADNRADQPRRRFQHSTWRRSCTRSAGPATTGGASAAASGSAT